MTYKLVIADNSQIVRSGLVTMLRRLPSLRVVPYEVSTKTTLTQSIAMHEPMFVIVNPMFDGWFDVEQERARCDRRSIHFIALVSTLIDDTILQHYDATLSLNATLDDIASQLLNLLHHEQEESETTTTQDALSDREKEVVVCVVKGMTNKEIAEQLCLSIHTVITHRRNIGRKLQIHSPSGLTIYAIVNHLVTIDELK